MLFGIATLSVIFLLLFTVCKWANKVDISFASGKVVAVYGLIALVLVILAKL